MERNEWLELKDFNLKVDELRRRRVTRRRLALFSAACCRRGLSALAGSMRDDAGFAARGALDILESTVDSRLGVSEPSGVFDRVHFFLDLFFENDSNNPPDPMFPAMFWMMMAVACSTSTIDVNSDPFGMASNARACVLNALKLARPAIDMTNTDQTELDWQLAAIHDVFGPPSFTRIYQLDPKCRCEAVVRLAAQIYYGRTFERLTELAVISREIGVKDEVMLCHLERRLQQPHVKGCWALDLILDKA
jgi:hypothetical protein